MAALNHNITRDEPLNVGPRVSVEELNGRKSYGVRMLECEQQGHITTVWLLAGRRRYLCMHCGRTWAQRPRERAES